MTDWKKVLQIFKYINQTKDYYLQYKRDGNLNGYTDSDFAGDIINSKSTSGNIYFLASGPVLWMSRQQQCVSRSTAEAEYVALSEAVANGLWLKNILEELFNKKFKINLYGDNKASLYSAENFAIGKRLRHIRVSYHFFKEHVKIIMLFYNISNPKTILQMYSQKMSTEIKCYSSQTKFSRKILFRGEC